MTNFKRAQLALRQNPKAWAVELTSKQGERMELRRIDMGIIHVGAVNEFEVKKIKVVFDDGRKKAVKFR